MIQFKDVSKIYRMGENSLRALDHANMHIREGEYVSIIGPSGSGKSTLMNIVGCLDLADEGEYFLDGQEIRTYKEDQLARIRNEKIGFVFQNFNLIGKMTAWDNIELPLIYQRLPRARRKERVEEALRRVGLYDRRTHRSTELSGGQQQRVAIARAISTRPSLFLADEPTGNLDSRTGEEIMGIFRELHEEGNTIVLITHDPSVADKAQRQIRIRDGKVQEL
jgi:putative ABC transport system ATP-binding protein